MGFEKRTFVIIQVKGGKEWVTTPARSTARISSARPPHLYSSLADAQGALKQLARALQRDDLEIKDVVLWERVDFSGK